MTGVLPLLSLFFGCQPSPDVAPDGTAETRRTATTAEDVFSFSFTLDCDGEEDDPCATLVLDGSESTSTEGEIVSWYWEIDADTSDDTSIRFSPTFNDEGGLESHQDVALIVEDDEGNTTEKMLSIEVYVDSSESPPTMPFWFSVTPDGEDCERMIKAHADVGGCLITEDFDIGWLDFSTNMKTVFAENRTGALTAYNGATAHRTPNDDVIVHAEPVTPAGMFYLEKPEVGIINVHQDECLNEEGSGGSSTGE